MKTLKLTFHIEQEGTLDVHGTPRAWTVFAETKTLSRLPQLWHETLLKAHADRWTPGDKEPVLRISSDTPLTEAEAAFLADLF